MKRWILFAGGLVAASGIALGAFVWNAGGWDNFKLRHFHLTQLLSDQTRELADIRARNVAPEQASRIDLGELISGGPPKDGIPSIDSPRFTSAAETPFADDEPVLGVAVNGDARAYPYGILNWHEVVNDTVGGVPVTITYCPLCDTGLVFRRGGTTFGVSGKLYQSCLVMYDRADDTLYVQPWGIGAVGPAVNRILERLPVVKTTLGAWKARHPDTRVLSTETGHRRDYFEYPYGSYYTDRNLVFPVRGDEQLGLHPKAIISYAFRPVEATPHNAFAGDAVRFVHEDVRRRGRVEDRLGDTPVTAVWDTELETVVVRDAAGREVPSSPAFAFVWPAFFGKR